MRDGKDLTFMYLEGQGAHAACGDADRSELDDRGYILVALAVAIAIASVWMAAALPAWRQQVTREREIELIFRGEQYARAIWLYQNKNNGQYPQNLDDLVNQHYLRKRWKDPITGEDFVMLPAGFCQTGVPSGGLPSGRPPQGGTPGVAPPAGGGPGGVSGGLPGRGLPAGGAPQLPTPPGGAQPGRGTTGPQMPFAPQQQAQSGICGVVSKSEKTSIKIYQQQQQHNLWRFTTLVAQQQYQLTRQKYGGGVAPPMGVPTLPGQPQRGQRPGQPGAPGGFNPIGPGRGGPGGGPVGFPPTPQGPGRDGRPIGPTPFPTGPGRGRE